VVFVTVRILIGDCTVRLKELRDNSVDSVVCDPPYHLTSIVKRFGSENAAPAKVGKTGAYARASRGFMGQTWDGGDVAFRPATWAEILRVLKPGGHLVAFSGTRTYHRMAVAIEDAGFEVRDMLSWLYGSGFPKSLDVSKAIDKRPGVARHAEFAEALKAAMRAKGYTNTFDVAEKVVGRRTGAVANWQKYQFPEAKWWPALRDLLDMSGEWDGVIAEAERAKTGERDGNLLAVAPGQANDRSATVLDITAPATEAAREWQGWGTALKPACEPICLARKPLSEKSVAANVLKWGTGAINVDGCRIEAAEALVRPSIERHDNAVIGKGFGAGTQVEPQGRWPANVCHDGSDEVVAGFPETQNGGQNWTSAERDGMFGVRKSGIAETNLAGDAGSAARFFYCAKAATEERGEGNNHPTVKPVALMEWLVKMVTPKGGTVLDPFMGSGSTALACDRLQFDFIGCELSPEYAAIAEARIRAAAGMFAEVKAA
jgi:DNA modification methylase